MTGLQRQEYTVAGLRPHRIQLIAIVKALDGLLQSTDSRHAIVSRYTASVPILRQRQRERVITHALTEKKLKRTLSDSR